MSIRGGCPRTTDIQEDDWFTIASRTRGDELFEVLESRAAHKHLGNRSERICCMFANRRQHVVQPVQKLVRKVTIKRVVMLSRDAWFAQESEEQSK